MTSKPIILNEEKRAAIKAQLDILKKTPKANLIAEVKRNHRVISIDKTFSKDDAISNLMTTYYGRREMDAYFS